MKQPTELHGKFLERAVARLRSDDRLLGVAIGGSAVAGSLDEFSDLDLIIAVEPASYGEVMSVRLQIADGLGPLLSGFSGEHVGEPRLVICMYGPPILHVDLKFVSVDDLADRVEDPLVLWERDKRLTTIFERGEPRYPHPDLEWIEDRFWTWIHYGAARVGRGELLEAVDMLAFLRKRVLGPLALLEAGERPSGVRRIERLAPRRAAQLQNTLGASTAGECADALAQAAQIYKDLRNTLVDGLRKQAAEDAALAYLD